MKLCKNYIALMLILAPIFLRAAENDEVGIAAQNLDVYWNSQELYDYQSSPDDLAYRENTIPDAFFTSQTSRLNNGYVYFHAIASNKNSHSVDISFAPIQFQKIFGLESFEAFNNLSTGRPNLELKLVSTASKSQAYGLQSNIVVKYFAFDMHTKEIGAELAVSNGYVTIRPQTAIIAKWYSTAKSATDIQLLPRGQLPKHSSCAPELFRDVYEKLDGKTDRYYFDYCSRRVLSDGKTAFQYLSVSTVLTLITNNVSFFLRIPSGQDDRFMMDFKGDVSRRVP